MIIHRLVAVLCFAALAIPSWALDASLSFATFKSSNQRFIELYLHIAGKSVTFAPTPDSLGQSGVEVLVLFKQADKIIKYDKYILNGPVGTEPVDFIDLKRYVLDDGDYQLIVAVKDVNNEKNAKEYATPISIDYKSEGLLQSDIELLASIKKETQEGPFVKNGFYMEPLPFNFYGRGTTFLSFYNELYGADVAVADDFVVSYSIEKIENEKNQTLQIGHKKLQSAPVIPLLIQMDISQLPSGNYMLVVEARSRTKALLSKKSIYFQRSNPFLNQEKIDLASLNLQEEFVGNLTPEELEYSLRAITPLLPQPDVELVNTILKNDSINAQRMYLMSFWLQRNPNTPKQAYDKYMAVARAIDKQFQSGFRHGFETDRGYVYLKYGQPSDMERRDSEPSAPPYEVWSYNEVKLTRQNNVRFIFYNPSLAPEDFVLLHSDAIGEINNPQWQRQLYRNAPNEIDSDDYFGGTGVKDGFNRNASKVVNDN